MNENQTVYIKPTIDLLNPTQERAAGKRIKKGEVENLRESLIKALKDYNIAAEIVDYNESPISVCFKLKIADGEKMTVLQNAKDDLQLALAANNIEVIQDRLDRTLIDVIVLFIGRSKVGLRSLIQDDEFETAQSPVTIAAGIDIFGNYIYFNLEDAKHLLVEGTTGSGKTIFIDDIILSLLYKASPNEVKMLLVDPKVVDLGYYNGLPHLLRPVITDMSEVFGALCAIEDEMNRRKELLKKAGVNTIQKYNLQVDAKDKMPFYVIVLDEYKEMIDRADKQTEEILLSILTDGRIAGIHVIVAAQSATGETMNSSIKKGLTSRISFSNATKVKFANGRMRLLGSGDMVMDMGQGTEDVHGQAAFVTYEEMQKVVKKIINNNS